MTSPRVTVLMPVFNAESYLAEAIESILGQTYTDMEILIIDDGSTDHSASIIASYRDPRIRVVQNDKNMTLVPTLNLGLDLANGYYIARMDADDVALPNRIEAQVRFLDAHPEIVVCGTGMKVIGSSTVFVPPTNPEVLRYKLHVRNCIAHPTVMFRASTLRDAKIYYNSDFTHAEDYELWNRLSENYRIANISRPLLHYRLSEEGVSRRHVQEQRRLTAIIATNCLHRIGVDWDQEQLQNPILTKNEVRQARELIFSMISRDLSKKVRSVLWFLWLDSCTRGATHGLWSIGMFYSIPGLRRVVSISDTLKFIIKAILRRKTTL